jgi:starch synthase
MANKLVASTSPVEAIEGKEDWLFLTVPSTLVAGANASLYYNKRASPVLCDRPNVELHVKFNDWELASDKEYIDMESAGVADFVKANFVVPSDAYAMDFIFSDKEGAFDNNDMQNYACPVEGEMTQQRWLDLAPERAEAEFLRMKEQRRVEAEEAEREREKKALEQDRYKAMDTIDHIKREHGNMQAGAGDYAALIHKQRTVRGSLQVKILYNREDTVLSGVDDDVNLRVGHNGWQDVVDLPFKKTAAAAKKQGDWFEASIKVPLDAVVLNMVPFSNDVFDNNNGQDYCVAVDRGDVDAWADTLLEPLTESNTAARHAEEAKLKQMEKEKELARQAVRDKAERVKRLQMKHVLYTKPEQPVAGKDVTLCYNPNNTVLNGNEEIRLNLGYNRWSHAKSIAGAEMSKSSLGGDHYELTVPVPKDAYSLDFVFSNGDGSIYDNRGGLDYNIPVQGSVVEEPSMYVVNICVEMAPIAKVGGMGDVVTALSRAVQDLGHTVEVVLPKYDFFRDSPLLGGTQYETEFDWGGTRIFVSTCIVEGVRCWFLEPANGMFSGAVYHGSSDAARFEFFSKAALEFLLRTSRQPDIIHCHDWSTATVARSYWEEYHHNGLYKPSVVFTIHNLNYGADLIGQAAYYSQKFTTVSPTYAWEIGGNPAIASNNSKLVGIRNGIDVDIWSPETNQFIPVNYSAANCEEGKAAAREALRQRLGLTGWGDKPLVGVVTRLTKQKGTHLIKHSCWKTLERGGQFVLLGSAPDPKVQAEFEALADAHRGENAAFCFAFDEALSHLIYAACDMILVPSMFEPCGLTQMIAMRYGAVPVVRSTGGLKDTVFDVDTDKARAAWEMEGSTDWESDGVDATNGFSFEGTDEGSLDYALNRAMDAYYNDREWFRGLQARNMKQDFSWSGPAVTYISLYHAAARKA